VQKHVLNGQKGLSLIDSNTSGPRTSENTPRETRDDDAFDELKQVGRK